MCGIVGFIDRRRRLGDAEARALLAAMSDSLAHRGPDDSGQWWDAETGCALGHRRLSIIDLRPEGRQPMSAPGADTVVTFNGEIYNFQDLRAELVADGHAFRSRSDTEILPHLFDGGDPSALARLNGMFAVAAWSPRRRELMLARDPFGKKPLYVYEDDEFFAFASEIQAFRQLPGFRDDIDPDALAEYLLVGYLVGPRTIYRSVRLLPAGSFETHRLDGRTLTPTDSGAYFRFRASGPERGGPERRFAKERLRERLIRATELRMISDVPLGAFLSGGVDSSLVCAIVRRELGRELDTFSIGFAGTEESEHEAARQIAGHLGARHHDSVLAPDAVELIHTIAGALDQPNGDSSCLPTYLLSEFARRHVTVVLSGDGGDELFGGYGRYRDTLNEWADPAKLRAAHGLDPAAAAPSDLYMSLRWHIFLPAQAGALLGGLPAATAERLAGWREGLDDDRLPLLHRMRNLDAAVYMPGAVLAKVDRMSMRHALEVRSPLLDPQVAELAMSLSADDCWAPPAETKRLLKELACDYLPAEWMRRAKKGFGLPANAWSMARMLKLARELLLAPDACVASHFDRTAVAAMIEAQARPETFSIYQLWPMLVLELWLRRQTARAAPRQLEHA